MEKVIKHIPKSCRECFCAHFAQLLFIPWLQEELLDLAGVMTSPTQYLRSMTTRVENPKLKPLFQTSQVHVRIYYQLINSWTSPPIRITPLIGCLRVRQWSHWFGEVSPAVSGEKLPSCEAVITLICRRCLRWCLERSCLHVRQWSHWFGEVSPVVFWREAAFMWGSDHIDLGRCLRWCSGDRLAADRNCWVFSMIIYGYICSIV
jgi:hypothetical protein